MNGKAAVKEYMTREVQTVSPADSVADVAKRIVESDGHNGFPVCEGRKVEGFVTARDLLLENDEAPIFTVMTEDIIVAHPDMAVNDAARVILRSGIQKLPVVDDAGNLVGIISNTDVIRSQIERATPEKVGKLMRTLEQIHGITVHQEHDSVELDALIPTQGRVYADELEGRKYELERGLAEPLVVINNNGTYILADGHHRVMAAHQLGTGQMDAYIIVVDDPIELGMQRTAEKEGLNSIEDIDVVDYARHPLVETTHRLQRD
ncbi:CBS domain-containing protein [Halogeometricum borinquense]|uniref:CBS domain-containing protein n=1 Tax=Halogeometricum borinquense TaxID=60847 RepID=A0A6C0UE74_9EURY|nr:CBS domain-containing protein [Halogeometricum borinquense]QIB73716.1 CBS domain-containing protein [Halogeometricum borinquense]QIQ76928.1 CBS domain-containing protein [Halogeometricum borinquense]